MFRIVDKDIVILIEHIMNILLRRANSSPERSIQRVGEGGSEREREKLREWERKREKERDRDR